MKVMLYVYEMMVKVIINIENEGTDDVYQFTLSQSSQGERKHKKKPRGGTQMKELIIKRSDNKKEVVTYNEWGQPTGDEDTINKATSLLDTALIKFWTFEPKIINTFTLC
ncbi:hypothetical protein PanWU01x14_083120 [Parasponia andersonii]|uniref:Uncharacterized protein n=1 Tax=Parasponia andersonii TaxID=3476 RepID=A0A2P5DA30_PARAD|nr:hypothetical protein PanWU01x14_083120 [Parasponia andersonii]